MNLPASYVLLVQVVLGVILGVLGVGLARGGPGRSRLLGGAFAAALVLALMPAFFWSPPAGEGSRRIRVVSVLDGETTDALVRAFSAETGIGCDVDPFAGGTQSTVELILQGRLQPDVILGGTVEIHEELAVAGRLSGFQLGPDPGRIDHYDDPAGNWIPLYVGYLGVVYRPSPSFQAHAPDWLTLIAPRWKGRVAIPAPDQSGGGLVFLATQILRQDKVERAWEYFELLDQNEVRYEARSAIPITRVAAGTMDLGVAWAHDVMRRVERERLPVELSIPEQTGLEVGGVSILTSARDEGAARDFVRFLTGTRAAEIQAATGFRVPLRTDVEPPSYLDPDLLGNGATDFYDRQRVLQERRSWIDGWRERRATSP